MDTKALRQKILDLAIRGKLVPQDPNDEPASVLLERIRAEKERLIAEGKIKRPKKPKTSSSESHYQNLPNGWSECKIEDVAKTLTDFVASGSFASLRENVKYYDSPNYAILVRTKDLGNSFKRGLVYTDKHGYDFLSNSNLYGGELILPNIGASIGKVFLMPKIEAPTTLAPNSIMIRCWEEPTLKWLYLLFQSTLGQNILASISASTAQGKFNKTDLRDVIIPLPPLYEQERILTQADRLLEYVEKINTDKTDLTNILNSAKSKILELAMQGKLVPQDPADEPAADMLRRVNPKARIITDNPHYPQLPSNWVYVSLEDIVDYDQPQPFIVNDTNYSEEYSTPVLTAGKSFILGYTNEDFGIYNKLPAIIFDDFTTDSHLVDFPFKVKSSAMKILTVKEGINVEFVSYFMSITRLFGDTHKRYWISEYSKLLIPIPPRSEQVRIVEKIKIFNEELDIIENQID